MLVPDGSAAEPWVAAWEAVGRPAPRAAATVPEATCCGCHRVGVARRVSDTISDKWTGWEHTTATIGERYWCDACAWANADTDRSRRWAITPNSTIIDPTGLAVVLSAPLRECAVVIPVGRKKHLLPRTRWGCVTTDDGPHPWTTEQAARFVAVGKVKAYGFSEADMHLDTPPFKVVSRLPVGQFGAVLDLWGQFEVWRRADSTLLQAALIAHRTPKRPGGTHADRR